MVNTKINNKCTYKEYLNSLDECEFIANEEAKRLDIQFNNLVSMLKDKENDLNEFINEIESIGVLKDDKLKETLLQLNSVMDEKIEDGIEYINNTLQKKKENLSKFTVALFGRTKAGKSTLRETLTNGDGSTIGQGSQRTTRDIKEYTWNNLRIIDTPGISAYEGDDDVKLAESIISEADLILFLVVSDSIQESEFEKLVELKSLNKPIVILLNVKQAIDKDIYMRRFLKDYNDVVSIKGQEGHVNRIKDYCKKYLGTDKINIIPIHAMAGFESTRTEDEELKMKLYNASQINKVKYLLREIIINEGRQKRVLTFRDEYILYLNSLENVFWDSYKEIKPRIKYIKEKHKDIKEWFVDFEKKGKKTIDVEVGKIYNGMLSEVDDFIDRYAGDKTVERLWNDRVKAHNVEGKVNEIYKDLYEEANRNLNEFYRQFEFEISNLNFDNDLKGVKNLKKGVIGRVARWGSVVLDGVFLFSLTNFWNPAGWVGGLIGIGGAILTCISWFFGTDSKRYDKQKSEAKMNMKKSINKGDLETKKLLQKHFKKNIINPLYKNINNILEEKIKTLEAYLDNVKVIALDIRKNVDIENAELYREIYRQTFSQEFKTDFIRIAREQGIMSKILVKEDIFLKYNKYREILRNIIGERIIYVEFTNDSKELLKRALYPAKIDNIDIEFNLKDIVIKAKKDDIRHIIGKGGRNIKLTNRILDDFNINIEEV